MSEQHYEIDGLAAVWDSAARVAPKVFKNGQWETFYGVPRFAHDAYPISKERFDQMVAYEMQLAADRHTTEKQPPRADRG